MTQRVAAINGGSSSLKAAVFDIAAPPRRVASVKIERIGSPDARLSFQIEGKAPGAKAIEAATHDSALEAVRSCLDQLWGPASLSGVGHRLVHGGPNYFKPRRVTPDLLEALRDLEPFDPEHLPAQLRLIASTTRLLPSVPQVACFDTAFHHDLPAVARRLPIPRRFDAIGVRRYGFHGLSFAYLMEELRRLDPRAADGRVILAHLGNGASLAAVRAGQCIDTSMALTPAAGVPMGTRSGDLDPGLVDYLARVGGLTIEQFSHMVHLESGLLGVSETSSDMQRLLELESSDARAAEAVEIFCYQVRKWIGAYAAALGGCETIVFAGGIGERAGEIRRRICLDLRFLGVELDPGLNARDAELISTGALPVKVRVIATDEERMIAQDVIGAI